MRRLEDRRAVLQLYDATPHKRKLSQRSPCTCGTINEMPPRFGPLKRLASFFVHLLFAPGSRIGRRRPVAERRVGPSRVVVLPPFLYAHSGLFQRGEPVLFKALLPNAAVEGLDERVARGRLRPTERQVDAAASPTAGLGNLQLCGTPEVMYPLAIDHSALMPQERPHPPITVARMALSEGGEALRRSVVRACPRLMLHGSTIGRYQGAGSPLRRPCSPVSRSILRSPDRIRRLPSYPVVPNQRGEVWEPPISYPVNAILGWQRSPLARQRPLSSSCSYWCVRRTPRVARARPRQDRARCAHSRSSLPDAA
jgi:hypothetical protein